jgi:hypothetical protein
VHKVQIKEVLQCMCVAVAPELSAELRHKLRVRFPRNRRAANTMCSS